MQGDGLRVGRRVGENLTTGVIILYNYADLQKSVIAGVAQLVERNLAKVEVAGSNPVSRSTKSPLNCHPVVPVVPKLCLGMRPAKLCLANLPIAPISSFRNFHPARAESKYPKRMQSRGMKISGIPPDSGRGLRQ